MKTREIGITPKISILARSSIKTYPHGPLLSDPPNTVCGLFDDASTSYISKIGKIAEISARQTQDARRRMSKSGIT